MLNSLKTAFSAPAAALAVSAAGLISSQSAAAQEAPVIQANFEQPINWVEDARTQAIEWNAEHPDDLAIAVYVGYGAGQLTPEQLKTGLPVLANAEGEGIDPARVELIFERSGHLGHTFELYYQDIVQAPLTMDNIIQKTQKAGRYLSTDEAISNDDSFEPPLN